MWRAMWAAWVASVTPNNSTFSGLVGVLPALSLLAVFASWNRG